MREHMPWFRVYSEIVDDEKLRLLAFEDRWHYVALLSCKCSGLLDSGDDAGLLRRKVAVKLGLTVPGLDEVARRLDEVGLIDAETLQPLAWESRQFKSDNSTERVKAYRERMKRPCNVSETAQDTDTDTDTEQDQKQKQARAPRTRPAAAPKPADVSEPVWADWLALRKAKRAPVTGTVLAEARREADKAGLALERFLQIWCSRGSQGLQADWLKPAELGARAGPSAAPSKHLTGMAGFMGVDPHDFARDANPRLVHDADSTRLDGPVRALPGRLSGV